MTVHVRDANCAVAYRRPHLRQWSVDGESAVDEQCLSGDVCRGRAG